MVTGAEYANGGNAKAQLCISAWGLDWDEEMMTMMVMGQTMHVHCRRGGRVRRGGVRGNGSKQR
jgi:hypothetical protein